MKVCKVFSWSAGHNLQLPYPSKCSNHHGHNYLCEVEVEGKINDLTGMVMDFSVLKELVTKISFDHKHLNDINCPHCKKEVVKGIMKNNPTAENLVLYIKEALDKVWICPTIKISRIRVWETLNSYAEENY